MNRGRVYLVGAGPGDPGLITRRGLDCLRRADVVVYDALVHPRLLDEAPPGAEKIDAGKRAGRHTLPQEEINALLVRHARRGRTVVRLKGGDPTLFGRGGEEALALRRAGIPFEIVPGVPSALAAPACAGIPVTHRGIARGVAIVAGHRDPRADPGDVDWESIARFPGTKVVLMGMNRLDSIVERLIEGGLDPATPAAAVRWGTLARQRCVVAPLRELPARVREASIGAPAAVVIGEVVELRDRLEWFERRPLFGRRIVITRPRRQAGALRRLLSEAGAEVLELPMIRILLEGPGSELEEAVREIRVFDWIVFTSVNGVESFFERFDALYRDIRSLGNVRIACLGPATAEAVRRRGPAVDLLPAAYLSMEIASEFRRRGVPAGSRLLLPRASIASPDLPRELRRIGMKVRCVAAYRTAPEPSVTPAELDRVAREGFDWVVFTSSSTARMFARRFGRKRWEGMDPRPRVMSIGPVTSETVRSLGWPVDGEATRHTIEGIVERLLAGETGR